MHALSLSPQSFSPARSILLKRLMCQAAVVSSLALGACAGGVPNPFEAAGLGEKPPVQADEAANTPKTELQKATAYWGKEYEKHPNDAQAALNYVRNLKALGAKPQALGVIQAAYGANPNNKALASEYGRLALDQEQISLAEKLLAQADDPVAPDWKTISARGTVFAKQGKYREAIPHFERALALAPGQPAILNNLALAHAMDGHADKAEPMLRQAAVDQNADPKVGQNLSLVLGLQGKTEDAKRVMVRDLPAEEVNDDASYVKEMVRAEPVKAATTAISTSSTGKSKSKAAKGGAAPEDPSIAVQRLADGYSKTPADAPVQLVPKQ